jgi:acyl carrier protein
MTSERIYEELTEILDDVFGEDDLVATPELTAGDVPGWDSMAHLRVIFAVERRFGVKFSASQIDGLANVGELASLIESKLAQ